VLVGKHGHDRIWDNQNGERPIAGYHIVVYLGFIIIIELLEIIIDGLFGTHRVFCF
jgi:hypothetical protein